MQKLNAKELRTTDPSAKQIQTIKKQPIYIVVDNVLDTYNVGSIFRLADATAVQKVFLCGETLKPPNPRINKASIDTWKWVEWEYSETAVSAILNLKSKILNLKVVAVEQDEKSVRFDQVRYELPLAIVVGNETYGVSKDVLDMADAIVELPMRGVNKSLNVMVSCGIVLYEIMSQLII